MSCPPQRPYKPATTEQGHSMPIGDEIEKLRHENKLLIEELLHLRAVRQLAAHLECSQAMAERILNIETRIGKML